MREIDARIKQLLNYSLAMVGPVGSAGAQFALSLVLLKKLDSSTFGIFTFLLVATQFTWGVWGALFCAPLPVILTSSKVSTRAALLRSLFASNLLGAAAIAGIFLGLALQVGLGLRSALLFAAFSSVSLVRWFARSYAYAHSTPARAAFSDMVYCTVLLLGVAVIWYYGDPSLALTWGAMLTGTCAGFLPFAREYLRAQFTITRVSAIRGYAAIWRDHSRWSLLGVFSTEATANSHVYIITLLRGPTAFAPLAASALLIRPISVAMNALTEFERARMARQIGDKDLDAAVASARYFRFALIATWVGTALATASILAYWPGLVFPSQYSLSFIATGAALWMVVAAVRLLRMPESCLLQAAGAFRPLAAASVLSSVVSLVGVFTLLLLGGALWSIVGILLGETVFALWIWRQTRMWLRQTKVSISGQLSSVAIPS